MIDIETVQFPVGGQFDAATLLGVKDNSGGIEDGLLAGQGREPVDWRVGADGSGLDSCHEAVGFGVM